MELLELIIDEEQESGVSFISLVDSPAIESLWMAFNKQKPLDLKFKIQDEEKRIVSGYFMIADLPIARVKDDSTNDLFYVVFRKNTIESIVNKFFKNGLTSKTNLMHNSEAQPEGVYVIESLIIDNKRGIKAPEGFEKVPDGSWWGSMRIENDDVWELVQRGEFKGFSVEGMFAPSKTLVYPETLIRKIKDVVKKFKK